MFNHAKRKDEQPLKPAAIYDGNKLFNSLPREVLGLILVFLSKNDFVLLGNTSHGMSTVIEKARLTGQQLFWQKHQTDLKTFLAEAKDRYLKKYYEAGKAAYSHLENKRLSLPVFCLEKGDLIKLCVPTNFLCLAVKVKIEDHLLQLQKIYGLNKWPALPVETCKQAAVLVFFVNNQEELVFLEQKIPADGWEVWIEKTIIIAHPKGVKISPSGRLNYVHGFFELSSENCNEDVFARHVLNVMRKAANVFCENTPLTLGMK